MNDQKLCCWTGQNECPPSRKAKGSRGYFPTAPLPRTKSAGRWRLLRRCDFTFARHSETRSTDFVRYICEARSTLLKPENIIKG